MTDEERAEITEKMLGVCAGDRAAQSNVLLTALREARAEEREVRVREVLSLLDSALVYVHRSQFSLAAHEYLASRIRFSASVASKPDPTIALVDHLRAAGVWEPGDLLGSVKRLVEQARAEEQEVFFLTALEAIGHSDGRYARILELEPSVRERIRSRGDNR